METRMMKQSFADQMKAQNEFWKAQVMDHQERLEQTNEKARENYKKAVEQMEAKAQEAQKMAERVRGANEATWKDIVAARLKAFAEHRPARSVVSSSRTPISADHRACL
jgi:RNA polymerase-binding transcription factor DksA